MHPIGSYCTDISRYTVTESLNKPFVCNVKYGFHLAKVQNCWAAGHSHAFLPSTLV